MQLKLMNAGKVARASSLIILAVIMCSTVIPVSRAETGVDWWRNFGHDLLNSRTSPYSGPLTNQTLWKYTAGGPIRSSAAVVDGVVYFGSWDGVMHALNAIMGAEIWSVNLGERIWSSPAVADGRVYVGTMDNNTTRAYLFALNALTGEKLWQFSPDSAIFSGPTVDDGVVYLASNDSKLYALNETTGKLKWSFKTVGELRSFPAVVDGVVYIGSAGGGMIYALDAATGSKIWNFTLAPGGTFQDSSPAVVGGVVYIGSTDFNVYALDASTGAKKWSFQTGNQVTSSPAVNGGVVYIGSVDGNVYALNASTGTKIWKYTEGSAIYSSPSVTNNVVYVGSWDGTILALDASNGTLIWSYKTGSVFASPAIVNGVIYIGSYSNNFYAFGTPDGRSWATNFNYQDLSEMQNEGWTISAPTGAVTLPGDGIVLDGSNGIAEVGYTSSIPTDIYDWKIDVKGMWLGGSGHSGLNVEMITERHTYIWALDGESGQYVFTRDGVKTIAIDGYVEKANEVVYLTIEKNGNYIGLYCNGKFLKYYAETDKQASRVTGVTFSSPSGSRSKYTYIGAFVPETKVFEEPTQPKRYTVTITTIGVGSVSKTPEKATYLANESIQVTATAGIGYSFTGWSGDITGSDNPKTITINANITAAATFKQIPYTLTVTVVGTGCSVTKNPSQATYTYGSSVQLIPVAATGWQFSGWSGDLSGSANPATITMNGNKSVTATFILIPPTQYTLTVSVVGTGCSVTKSPDQATYTFGTNVQLTAVPVSGWAFSGWSGDLSGSDNTSIITMDGNKAVTATFILIPANQYTLTVTVVGTGCSVTKNPSQVTYPSGSTVQLTPVAATGWQFSGWSGDLSGSANPATITINGNKVVTATFTKEQPQNPPPAVFSEGITNGTTVASSKLIVNYQNLSPETSSYHVRVDSQAWVDKGLATSYIFTGLSLGEHKFEVQAVDDKGNTLSSSRLNVDVSVWVPPATDVAASNIVTLSAVSIVSAIATSMSNPSSLPLSWLWEKINALLPKAVKDWLESFISSKHKVIIEQKTGPIFSLSKFEVLAYAVSPVIITLAFSYAGSRSFDQFIALMPIVVATSVTVGIIKNLAAEFYARLNGVWAEHHVWYFGLATFLLSTIVFRTPFTSPSRIVSHSPKHNDRTRGLAASLSIILSLIFAGLFYILLNSGFPTIGSIGLGACLLSAFFDVIPIAPMTGKDIYSWSKSAWAVQFIAVTSLYIAWLTLL